MQGQSKLFDPFSIDAVQSNLAVTSGGPLWPRRDTIKLILAATGIEEVKNA